MRQHLKQKIKHHRPKKSVLLNCEYSLSCTIYFCNCLSLATPNKFMNLFLSTLDQVANTMDNVVASLETLLGEINGVIQIEPEFPENAQGEHC